MADEKKPAAPPAKQPARKGEPLNKSIQGGRDNIREHAQDSKIQKVTDWIKPEKPPKK